MSTSLLQSLLDSLAAQLERQRRVSKRRRMTISVLSIATMISLSLGLFAWQKVEIANQERISAKTAKDGETKALVRAEERRKEAISLYMDT